MRRELTGNERMSELTIKQFFASQLFVSLLATYSMREIHNVPISIIVEEANYAATEIIKEFNNKEI